MAKKSNGTTDEQFDKAVKAMEKRTRRISAYVVISKHDSTTTGRYVISYPADGAGRVNAIAWLPGQAEADMQCHCGSASGYGYDKATAAMGGAKVWDAHAGALAELNPDGLRPQQQLGKLGYTVIQAC